MLLYLIRHAEAEVAGLGGVARDFDRPLTARGRDQARTVARAFLKHRLDVDVLATSPLVRAYQTATEFLSIVAPGQHPVTCDELALEKLKPSRLSDFLYHLPPSGLRLPSRNKKAVAAVGHMPDLGAYIEWLIGAAAGTVHVTKAAAACIECDGRPEKGAGKLLWLVPVEWV